MAKNILLTGATGFIGSQILSRLIEKKYKVVILIRPASDCWRIAHLQEHVSTVIIDGVEAFDEHFKNNNIHTVIHAATEYGRSVPFSNILMSNVIFPARLIEAGINNGLQRFINTDTFFSKQSNTSSYLKEYIVSKRIIKEILINYSSQIKVDNLRLEHPYGEYDGDSKFVSTLIKSLLQNKEELFFTSGEQKRDFIYIQDVVEAFITLLEDERTIGDQFTEYEVGTGKSVKVREFIETVAKAIGSKSRLNFGTIPNIQGELQDSSADITKLAALGWAPQYNVEAAIARIIAIEKKDMADIKTKTNSCEARAATNKP